MNRRARSPSAPAMRLSRRLVLMLSATAIIFLIIYLLLDNSFSDDTLHRHHHHHQHFDVKLSHFRATLKPPPLLRILVLAYNRANSLARCLESLNAAKYDEHHVTVEVHVDRARDGSVHNATVTVAKGFIFQHGTISVHVKPKHAGVLGQWLASWKVPRENSSEVALFIEDDIIVSPYFARWLWMVHEKYDSYPAVNGYTLQGESIRHANDASSEPLEGPPGQTVFLYPVLGSWGFSPNTARWRDFLGWYQEASRQPNFIPYVPGLKPSGWYKDLHQSGRAETMWTMWHIYFAHQNHEYTLYPNLPEHQGLVFNWKEPGMHYSKSEMGKGIKANLLTMWRGEDLRLPENLIILDARGEVTGKLDPPWAR